MAIERCNICENGQQGNPNPDKGKGIVVWQDHSQPGSYIGNIIIKYNTIHENYTQGIYVGAVTGSVEIFYNLIFENGKNNVSNDGYWGGVAISNYWVSNCEGIRLYNNVLWENEGQANDAYKNGNLVVYLGDNKTLNLEAKNNIIGEFLQSRPGYDISYALWPTATLNLTSDYNCIYRSSGDCIKWTGNIWDSDHIVGSEPGYYSFDKSQDQNSIARDPLFVNGANDDFHLQSTSPAIDAGIDVGLSEDYEGTPVPQGSAPDIGVYEYIDESKVTERSRLAEPFCLMQNYPNPFNSQTTISYQLSASANVTLKIYDILGRDIRTLVIENQPIGNYSVIWDGKNDLGECVGSGVYFYQLKIGNKFSQTKRLMLLR